MKYHSTKKSVFTISIIITLLLIISAIGIFRFQAETPVQAVSRALLSNLEMPGGYEISVENINESFLLRQKIDKISIKKNNKDIISITNLSINQNLLNYLGFLFFDKPLNVKIDGGRLDINIIENIDDLVSALSKIKIKDNTIALQSKLETTEVQAPTNKIDIKELLNSIIQQKYIDLSPILGSQIIENSYQLNISEGYINYIDDSIQLNTEIKNLNLELARLGILNSFNFKLSNISFKNPDIKFNSSDFDVNYIDNQIQIDLSKLEGNYLNNLVEIDKVLIGYDLEKIGEVEFDLDLLEYKNNNIILSMDKINSQLNTNFSDFSLILNPINTNLQLDANYLKFNEASIGLSSVDKKLSFYYKSAGISSILINNDLVNILNLDLSLFSKKDIFDVSRIKIQTIEYNNENLSTRFDNLDVNIDSVIDSNRLVSEGQLALDKLNIDNLVQAYHQINLVVSSDINIQNSTNKISSSIYSTVELQDNFNNITVSIESDNIKFDELDKLITANINLQGPLKLEQGKSQTLEANLSYANNLFIKVVGQVEDSFNNNHINTSILFNEFNPTDLSSYLSNYFPAALNYLSENTSLKGSLSYDGNIPLEKSDILEGTLNSSLLIKEAEFLDNNYNIGVNFDTKIIDQLLNINQLSLSLFDFRLAFNGEYTLNSKTISGSLDLENIDKDIKLVEVNFDNKDSNSTGFTLKTSKLQNFSWIGSFKNMNSSKYKIESLLNLNTDIIDLDIDLDLKNLIFKAISEKGLILDVNINDNINADIVFDDFNLLDLDNSIFNGKLVLKYKNNDSWLFDISDFDFAYNNSLYNLIINGNVTQNSIDFDRIDYYNNNFGTKYYGLLNYSGPKYIQLFNNNLKDHYKFNFTFGDKSSQTIEASIFNDSTLTNMFFDVSNFNISRFFNITNEVLLDARVIGSTDFDSTNDITGTIEFNETGTLTPLLSEPIATSTVLENLGVSNNTSLLNRVVSFIPFINLPENTKTSTAQFTLPLDTSNISFETNVNIAGNDFIFEDLNLSLVNLDLNNAKIKFNRKDFDFSIQSGVELIKPSVITNQKSSFDIDFYINFLKVISKLKEQFSIVDINYNSIISIYNRLRQYKTFDYDLLNNIYGQLNIENIVLFEDTIYFEKLWEDNIADELNIPNINTTFSIFNNILSVNSEDLIAVVNLKDKEANISIGKNLKLSGEFLIDYKDKVDIYATNLDVPVAFVEKLIYLKLVKFYGDNLTGNLLIKDLFNTAKMYGQIDSRSFKVKTLYTKDNEIEAPNISILFNEDKIYSDRFKLKYFDIENNEKINCYASFQVSLPKFQYENFSIEIESPNYVPVYLPLDGMNLTIDVKGKNYFRYSSDKSTSYLEGDVVVKDAVVRSGVDLLPWIVPRQETNGNFKIQTDDNNIFYYPYIDNPILNITMSKNQNFEIKFDSLSKTNSSEGSIDILQGEIFYFQKNFYINNGTFSLRLNSETKLLEPIISLEATLREIDSDGESIDIILNVNNNSLDNINPIFTSIPTKDTKEIMSILGQSFSGSNTSDSNSVASIATAATSVFSSLGYIETGGISTLNKAIASSLNLDFFSLKSNIVENIILETFIEDPRYSSYSPIARYLNNTTIFMGKYLTTNSKFQIMINLLADNDEDNSSFISSDLSLDFEMSYEIENDLAKFSFFTNPTQLSIIEILDTIGFSVTKTIHLR